MAPRKRVVSIAVVQVGEILKNRSRSRCSFVGTKSYRRRTKRISNDGVEARHWLWIGLWLLVCVEIRRQLGHNSRLSQCQRTENWHNTGQFWSLFFIYKKNNDEKFYSFFAFLCVFDSFIKLWRYRFVIHRCCRKESMWKVKLASRNSRRAWRLCVSMQLLPIGACRCRRRA